MDRVKEILIADLSIREAYPELHWTGWKLPANDVYLCGSFLWHGAVDFFSGTKDEVFYYVPVSTPENCVTSYWMGPDSPSVVVAYKRACQMRKSGELGVLMRWPPDRRRKRRRFVKSVVWYDWFTPVPPEYRAKMYGVEP